MRNPLTSALRRPLRGGFERRLLASAGLHATVLGILAAAGAQAALGEARARRDAQVHIARPAVEAWPNETAADAIVEERRPLDEIEPVEPHPTAAAVELLAKRPPSDPALEELPDTEPIWSALTRAHLRRPSSSGSLETTSADPLAAGPRPAEELAPEPEAEASASAAEEPTSGARPLHAPAPEYPRASLRLGEEGVVLCTLHVAVDGTVVRVEVVESSGHRRLDEAALAALRTWRFAPARTAGSAVTATFPHRVVFRLNDAAR